MHPQFSLLQARNPGDDARQDEHRCFAARLGVSEAEIRAVDILREPLDQRLVDETAVFLVGGAGEYSVLDDLPEIRAFCDFLARLADTGRPTFASCFGFQALVVGLGGSVISDEPNAEVGTYDLELLPTAGGDPLFSRLPAQFKAQLGHKDRADALPSCLVALARSERTPIQAVRVSGKPLYATQFHPELSWRDNRSRFERYMPTYGKLFGRERAQAQLDSHRPSPEANTLLSGFTRLLAEGSL